jgi:hypothetical protein
MVGWIWSIIISGNPLSRVIYENWGDGEIGLRDIIINLRIDLSQSISLRKGLDSS